jgi:hypothetical protein
LLAANNTLATQSRLLLQVFVLELGLSPESLSGQSRLLAKSLTGYLTLSVKRLA